MSTLHPWPAEAPAHPSRLYRFFHRWWMPFVLRWWTRMRLEGLENLGELETPGPVVVVSNHVANIDSYIVGLYLPRYIVHYMARPEGLNAFGLGWYWRQLAAISADREGLALAIRILKAGGTVGVFPEGQMGPPMVEALQGSAVLALRTGARVLPAAIYGSERIDILSVFKPPRVTVRYGKARVLKRERGPHGSTEAMDAVMRDVAAMLPPSYRGYYGHDSDGALDPASARARRHRTRERQWSATRRRYILLRQAVVELLHAYRLLWIGWWRRQLGRQRERMRARRRRV